MVDVPASSGRRVRFSSRIQIVHACSFTSPSAASLFFVEAADRWQFPLQKPAEPLASQPGFRSRLALTPFWRTASAAGCPAPPTRLGRCTVHENSDDSRLAAPPRRRYLRSYLQPWSGTPCARSRSRLSLPGGSRHRRRDERPVPRMEIRLAAGPAYPAQSGEI